MYPNDTKHPVMPAYPAPKPTVGLGKGIRPPTPQIIPHWGFFFARWILFRIGPQPCHRVLNIGLRPVQREMMRRGAFQAPFGINPDGLMAGLGRDFVQSGGHVVGANATRISGRQCVRKGATRHARRAARATGRIVQDRKPRPGIGQTPHAHPLGIGVLENKFVVRECV